MSMRRPDPCLSVWILGDQLLAHHPALVAAEQAVGRENVRVVLIESAARTRRLPYQRKKLVLLFSAMRHYALQLAVDGHQVQVIAAPSFLEGLRQHTQSCHPQGLLTMAASEYRGRHWQQDQLSQLLGIPVTVLPNTQFLVGQHDPFPSASLDRRVVMETFYRAMRRHFDVLMDARGQPAGGRWNFDDQNRRPLPRGHQPPPLPGFATSAMTRQVMAEVATLPSAQATGSVDGFDFAVTRTEALAALEDFLTHRLRSFGPYEDAMSAQHATLYHSVLSPYLNLGLLEPLELVRAAEQAYHAGRVPINSAEGFVRQVLGWREYITWQYWRLMPALAEANGWDAHRPLPAFFWGEPTEMACLRRVVDRAISTGYSHHIERLMLICNFCLLAGIEPTAVDDWFLSTYVDAYEWVMLPNVLGMGLNADGGQTATKPYVASAAYISRMSDYCQGCRYNPKQRTGADACPFNFLYWNFLLSHEDTLRQNPRLGQSVLGLRHLDDAERGRVRAEAERFLQQLSAEAAGDPA